MSKFFNNYLSKNVVMFHNPRYFSNNMDNEVYKNKLHEVVKHDSRYDGTGHRFGSHKNLFHSHKNYKGRA